MTGETAPNQRKIVDSPVASAVPERSASLPVFLIGSPVNCADLLYQLSDHLALL